MTSEEAWKGSRPSVKHLRICGSLCHTHIQNERRRKLDDKSEALVLNGYHPTRAYTFYDPKLEKVVISRDVKIDEATVWNRDNSLVSNVTIPLDTEDGLSTDTVVKTEGERHRKGPKGSVFHL